MITGESGFIGHALKPFDRKDILFHCAWHGRDKISRTMMEQFKNVEMSKDYFNRAIDKGITKIIALGSQGEQYDDAYGIAKRATKDALMQVAENTGICTIWARLYSVYGPRDHPTTLISSTIHRLLESIPISLTESKTQWDFLYIDDAIRALIALADEVNTTGEYSIGAGYGTEVRSVIEFLRDELNPNCPIEFFGKDRVSECVADISNILADTTWEPTFTIEAGLKRTIKWNLNQRHSLEYTPTLISSF
jgi:nucleoside-diphosphate-sugar epimerase